MKGFIILLVVLSSQLQADMVALYEKGDHKQVFYKKNNLEGKLITGPDKLSLYPDISNDAKYVVYATGDDPQSLSLEVLNLKTNEKKTFNDLGFIIHPKFSPNSDRVYASFKLKGSVKNQIGYYDLLSEPKLNIIKTENNDFFPTPFLGNERLLFQRNKKDRSREIVIRNLVTGDEQIIDNGMSPSLSKDERFIAYTKKVQDNWDIYVYDRFSKKTSRVTNDPARDFSPSFEANGSLYYASDRKQDWVFSIYTQGFKDWSTSHISEKEFLSLEGSLYSPKFSGNEKAKLSQLSEMPGVTRSSFGSIAHNGKVYVIGGHQGREHTYPPESFTGRMTIYDIKSDKWIEAAPRNYKCHGFSVSAWGDYIYAFGGFAYEATTSPAWKSLDVIERYHIPTDTWEVIGEMPRKRSSNVVATVGSKAYLIGGWDSTPKFNNDIDGVFHDEIDVFDMETEELVTLDIKLPLKRRAFSGVVKDNKIYLVGGISEGGSHFALLDNVTQLDTQAMSFSELSPLPYGTFAPAVGVIDNSLFVFGGMLKMGKWEYEYVGHIYQYQITKDSWSHTGRYLNENKGFSQIIHYDSKIGVLGGHTYRNNIDEPVASFEVFEWIPINEFK